MLKKVTFVGGVLLVAFLALGVHIAKGNQTVASTPVPQPALTTGTNLLINGDFDSLNYPFYWRPTNHFVGGMWYEWFWTATIPEFIDGGINHHNVCYPEPPPGKICVDDMHNSSQGYIRWGASYVAGVYQPVSVAPCAYYEFEMYNRNDDSNYHPKVGIDPTGQGLPAYIPPDGDNLPLNCPPDGHSKCPNPGLKSPADLPPNIVWSPEFDHAAYTWAGQSVTVEAVSTTLTVWTYAAPEEAGSLSTYWDYASLVQVPPPSGMLVPEGALAAPDGLISGVLSGVMPGSLVIKWQTAEQAISQVLYHYVGPSSISPVPPIASATQQFEQHTEIGDIFTTSHSIKLQNLATDSIYDIALLSRRWTGSQCQSSVYVLRLQTTDSLIPAGTLPPVDGKITNVISATLFDSAKLNWQTTDPAFSQILYHYVSPITTTLPPIANTTQQYELKTGITAVTSLDHSIKLRNLTPLSVYDVALLSCRIVNDMCQTSVYVTRVQTTDLIVPAGRLPTPSSDVVGPIILPFEQSAYVIWQSPEPSYGQVLYRYIPPFTLPVTMTEKIYLPIVASSVASAGSTGDYESRTWPITTSTTLHVVQISGLLTNSLYSAVALSAWDDGEQNAISVPARFYTQDTPTQLAAYITPYQLVEQLQACLAGRKELRVCVNELK